MTERYPLTSPLDLNPDHAARYAEVVRLRLEVCRDRERPVTWHDDGSVHPGTLPRFDPLNFQSGKLDDAEEKCRQRKRVGGSESQAKQVFGTKHR